MSAMSPLSRSVGSPANTSSPSAAALILGKQFKQMQKDKDIPGISCGLIDNNVFEWEVMLMIPDDCKDYGGGYFSFQSEIRGIRRRKDVQELAARCVEPGKRRQLYDTVLKSTAMLTPYSQEAVSEPGYRSLQNTLTCHRR